MQSALIIPVPATEPAVGHHRAHLDRAATWGVPAHLTVIYPFLPPPEVTPGVLATLREITAAHPVPDLTFTRTAWFGDTVLWLAPDPTTPLIALTEAIIKAFPQAQPYGGAIPEIVPHLTIGHDHPKPALDQAAADVATHLPLHAPVTALHLIQGLPEPGPNWHTTHTFPLIKTA